MAFELFGHRAEFLQINDALRDGLGALIEKHFDATRTTKTYLNPATQVQLDCPYFSIDEDDDAESIQFKSLHNAIAFGIISQNDIQAYVDSRVSNPLSLVKFANNIVENFKNIFEAQAALYKEFVHMPDHKKALNHFDNTEFVKDFITLQLELLGKVEGIEAPLIAINKLIKYVPSSKAKDFENLINELIAPVYFGEGVTVSLPGNAEDAYPMLQDRFEAVLKDRFVSARNDDLECAVNENASICIQESKVLLKSLSAYFSLKASEMDFDAKVDCILLINAIVRQLGQYELPFINNIIDTAGLQVEVDALAAELLELKDSKLSEVRQSLADIDAELTEITTLEEDETTEFTVRINEASKQIIAVESYQKIDAEFDSTDMQEKILELRAAVREKQFDVADDFINRTETLIESYYNEVAKQKELYDDNLKLRSKVRDHKVKSEAHQAVIAELRVQTNELSIALSQHQERLEKHSDDAKLFGTIKFIDKFREKAEVATNEVARLQAEIARIKQELSNSQQKLADLNDALEADLLFVESNQPVLDGMEGLLLQFNEQLPHLKHAMQDHFDSITGLLEQVKDSASPMFSRAAKDTLNKITQGIESLEQTPPEFIDMSAVEAFATTVQQLELTDKAVIELEESYVDIQKRWAKMLAVATSKKKTLEKGKSIYTHIESLAAFQNELEQLHQKLEQELSVENLTDNESEALTALKNRVIVLREKMSAHESVLSIVRAIEEHTRTKITSRNFMQVIYDALCKLFSTKSDRQTKIDCLHDVERELLVSFEEDRCGKVTPHIALSIFESDSFHEKHQFKEKITNDLKNTLTQIGNIADVNTRPRDGVDIITPNR